MGPCSCPRTPLAGRAGGCLAPRARSRTPGGHGHCAGLGWVLRWGRLGGSSRQPGSSQHLPAPSHPSATRLNVTKSMET